MAIHPTVLDSALHVGLSHQAGNPGNPAKMRAHVPVYLEELYVSKSVPHQPGEKFDVYAHVKRPQVTEHVGKHDNVSTWQ